ncbi:MAG: NAD-dependent epimerase/dehydratase family protein [Cyanobacteria bacterium]|nr:NAD-dependent epimerase/dehydratase family protein [Cyanobacteriota bacterium]
MTHSSVNPGKTVFVTGASGFTGSHLVRALVDRGHQVRALVRKSSNLDRLAGLPVEFVYGDLNDPAAIAQGIKGCQWVFHTAAYVELGIVDGDRMWHINVEGTRNVMGAAKLANVERALHCSTIGIIGDTKGEVADETYQRSQVGFDSPYDRTKYEAQAIVDRLASQGLPVVSVLPSGIFGGDDPHFGPVIRQFLKGGLKLWAGGQRITGIVHVDDLVEGMILAVERGTVGDRYILSAGELTTAEMFTLLGQAAGIPAPGEAPEWVVRLLGNVLDPIGRLFNWQPPLSKERVYYIYDRCVRVSGDKARRELGWNPRSVPQIIEATLAEIRAIAPPPQPATAPSGDRPPTAE